MKLTIEKFQQLHAIASMEDDELEKATKLVQILLDKSLDQVDKMPVKKFQRLCIDLQRMFDLKVNVEKMKAPKSMIVANGNVYKLNYEIKKPFNTGRYIEVLSFSKGDLIEDMPNILASICTPMKWSWSKFRYVEQPFKVEDHEKYANDFKKADFRHGYNAMLFFCTFWAVLTNNTEDYSVLLMRMMRENKRKAQMLKLYLLKISDGSIVQNK